MVFLRRSKPAARMGGAGRNRRCCRRARQILVGLSARGIGACRIDRSAPRRLFPVAGTVADDRRRRRSHSAAHHLGRYARVRNVQLCGRSASGDVRRGAEIAILFLGGVLGFIAVPIAFTVIRGAAERGGDRQHFMAGRPQRRIVAVAFFAPIVLAALAAVLLKVRSALFGRCRG